MRRRLSGVALGLIAVLVLAAPVFADTVPGPGNFRDSGSSDYASAFATVCGQSSCTDTFVGASNVTLQHGERFVSVCVEQFTYPVRGGGKFRSLFGCNENVGPSIASDLSSASANATITADSCGRRSCSTAQVTVSLSLDAVAAPVGYSYTQKSTYGTCTDTQRVKGQASDAEGTMVVNGTSSAAFGQIGSETFAFSSRCR